MLLVQKYLKSGKTLDDLYNEHGVKSHQTNGKVCLNYNQIEAKDSDPLSQQCRGLVLNIKDFSIVACPMFRFFNKEQKEVVADIDWNTASFEEKLDGTAIIIYYFQDKWYCGTRGRCEADSISYDVEMTFSQMVEITINEMISKTLPSFVDKVTLNKFMDGLQADKNKTYVFELTSPLNRIVCKYNDFNLTLLAVRDNISLQEEDPKKHLKEFYGVPIIKTPKLYEFKNINHMIQVIRDWNPEDHEGIVVKDAKFNRMKIKNPSYVAFNHLRDSLSTSFRGCIEIILLGKDDDIAVMMPEFINNRIKNLKPVVQRVIEQTQQDFDDLKDIEDMKTFALKAKHRLWPAALFALKRKKTVDLQAFVLGNCTNSAKIPSTAVDTMLALCNKIDPNIINCSSL